MILENVKGVSEAKREKLNDIHIHTAEDLAMANPVKIEDTNGLSTTIISNAIEHIDYDKKFVDSEQLNYKCGYCEKKMGLRARKTLKMHQEDCSENPETANNSRYSNSGW